MSAFLWKQVSLKACILGYPFFLFSFLIPPPGLQGMAFTLEERLQLGIHGLLPPCFLSQDVQVLRVMRSYETRSNPLDK